MIRILLLIFLFLTFVSRAHAETISDAAAVRIIVGEAANQGLKGMICIGEVLRRRASVKGFYGYKANLSKRQSKLIWRMAAKAWEQSRYTNYTKGADHFENIHSFGKPWWVECSVKTYEYKDHVFYNEVRRCK